jgi:hypothetical protein
MLSISSEASLKELSHGTTATTTRPILSFFYHGDLVLVLYGTGLL